MQVKVFEGQVRTYSKHIWYLFQWTSVVAQVYLVGQLLVKHYFEHFWILFRVK